MTKPLPWHTARAWQTNTVLLLIGACMFLLARQLVSEYDHYTIGFSGVSGYSVILYFAACLIILTSPVDRYTFPIVLTVAIACRLVTLYPDPFLSSDVYRYVWDGIVQNAHISPYRYVPGDRALTFLRAPNQDIFDNINRRDYAHTIYPPAAQFIFYLIAFISPTLTFMKTAMVLFEGLTMYALVSLLRHMGVRREQTLLYAWCPILIWEVAGSGHLDAVAMAFICLALLFRYRRRPVVTGIFLGLAVLTKLYPIVLLPALMLRKRPLAKGRSFSLKGWDWKMPATTFGLVLVGYAAYSSVGKMVFGFLGGYAEEEGLKTGARYFLLELAQQVPGLHHLPTAAFYLLCIVVFGGLTIWSLKVAAQQGSDRDFLHPALALAFALMVLFSPHYAWYILWLVPFFTLTPSLAILVYVTGFFYGYTTELADPGPKMFLLNKYLYAAVLAAALIEIGLRRWPVYRAYLVQPGVQGES
jgi:alpha-1,6-mannosyltransferase